MQLLDFLQHQSTTGSNTVSEALHDIVNHIQISPNFCISHPNYKPLELPLEVVERFQRVSPDLQHKYLSLQLQSFIYGIYYNGYLKSSLALNTTTIPKQLENNTFLGVDIDFYNQLHESNSGKGYFDPGWCVIREESDSSLVVIKGGLNLHIQRESHLQITEQAAIIGKLVAVKMPRNLVQNGFYMAVSNAGINSGYEIARIYFNLTPKGAVAVMESLTQHLNEIDISFTFKVLYNPSDYKRYDSGVLYFERSKYEIVRQVLQIIYTENKSHFQAKVPLFTKLLAPGVALAEEPNFKFATQESFGMNRCQIVANGLLEAYQQSDESPDNRLRCILQQFDLLEIDIKRPYLNAKSEDIYTSLDLC